MQRVGIPDVPERVHWEEDFALVRESVRRQKVDRGALRELHGYFEHLASTEA